MIVPEGFLKETTDMQTGRFVRLSKDYLFGISEVLLSACCWKAYLIDDYGTLTLNIWNQMVAPSGDGKSLPIDKFLVPTLAKLEKLLETETERYALFLSDYTPEAIYKYFSEKRPNGQKLKKDEKPKRRIIYNLGILCKDEASMYMKAAMNKKYMADITEVESKIYDGILYRRITISRGPEQVSKCYKANISASTPVIYSLMSKDCIIQGGTNRYDFFIGNPLKPEDVELLNKDFFVPKNDMEKFAGIPEEFANKLLKLTKIKFEFQIVMDDNTNLMWREYEREMKLEAIKLEETNLHACMLLFCASLLTVAFPFVFLKP